MIKTTRGYQIRNPKKEVDIPFEPEKLYKTWRDSYPYMDKTCVSSVKDLACNYEDVPKSFGYTTNVRYRK